MRERERRPRWRRSEELSMVERNSLPLIVPSSCLEHGLPTYPERQQDTEYQVPVRAILRYARAKEPGSYRRLPARP